MADKKSSPVFEYVNAITVTKNTDILDSPTFAKDYVPFVVNRALSYFEDTVMAAALMNERPWLDLRLQFLFLLNSIRPRKRWSKWIKHQVPEDAKIVAEYYGCSLRHAVPLTALHTPDQLKCMKARVYKGGQS